MSETSESRISEPNSVNELDDLLVRVAKVQAAIESYEGSTDPAELPQWYDEGNILDHITALLQAPRG